MKFQFEKNTQIIHDLIVYCHSIGATDYHVDFHPQKDSCKFVLKVKISDLSDSRIEEFEHALSLHRQQEVEESYWAISYDSDSPCELVMLGMMLDESCVEYDGTYLTLEATRRHN